MRYGLIVALIFGVAVVAAAQSTRSPPQSATPIPTGDAWDRLQQDRLQKTLELQNEKELASAAKVPPPSRQEAAMLYDMEQQLEKMTLAVSVIAKPDSPAATRQKAFKDIDSLSGKLLSGVRFLAPGIEEKSNEPLKPIAMENFVPTFISLSARVSILIKGLREGVLSITSTRIALLQLQALQQAAKQRK